MQEISGPRPARSRYIGAVTRMGVRFRKQLSRDPFYIYIYIYIYIHTYIYIYIQRERVMFCLFFLVFLVPLVPLGLSSHSFFDTMVSDSIPVACPIDYPIIPFPVYLSPRVYLWINLQLHDATLNPEKIWGFFL